MTKSKFMKGLLGATALTVLSTGTAFAQNNFTPADTDVENTFSLNYQVSGVDQPTIDTGPLGTDTPTTFKVDRLVNVTVAYAGPVAGTVVAPGQTNAVLEYTVVNNGNDTHAYFLDIEDVTTNGAPLGNDNFDTTDPANTLEYSTDGGATFSPYNPATPPVLAPDAVMTVRVLQDIPTGVTDEQRAELYLIADTRDNDTGFPATIADAGGVNDPNATENVLADADGPAGAANDDVTDGAHSDLGTYLVATAEIEAVKTVHALPDSYCTGGTNLPASGAGYTPPADDTSLYFTPGSCIEYRILVTNDGTTDGTAIELEDHIENDMRFVDAEIYGFSAGSISGAPATNYTSSGTVCVNPGSACDVKVNAATLDGKATPAAAATEATLVIRMQIP